MSGTTQRVRRFWLRLRRSRPATDEEAAEPALDASVASDSEAGTEEPKAVRPVFWVDIKTRKPAEVPPPVHPPPARRVLVKPNGLPDLFQHFIDHSYAMMAQVEAAKQRAYNNEIMEPPEEYLDWTSEAPKPPVPTIPPIFRKLSASGRRPVDPSPALRIIHLDGLNRPENDSTTKRQKKAQSERRPVRLTPPEPTDFAVEMVQSSVRKRVTFQLSEPTRPSFLQLPPLQPTVIKQPGWKSKRPKKKTSDRSSMNTKKKMKKRAKVGG